ncbi:hypothetical protein [Bremerella sp. P1]|uniref:hypothetical protein n=1 Tax=Bremerella sp. P1 TaxID=3026424 RepID=UPI00236829C7|nr:hypothetical protein [Bremerella sp. P1]WDI41639.1 hypothetical protein PSR63_24575 [Bremerella sp. P1]
MRRKMEGLVSRPHHWHGRDPIVVKHHDVGITNSLGGDRSTGIYGCDGIVICPEAAKLGHIFTITIRPDGNYI